MTINERSRKSWLAPCAALLGFCVVASPVRAAPMEAETTPAASPSILGIWRALAPPKAPRSSGLLELRISATESGELRVSVLDQMRYLFGPMDVALKRDAERYRAAFEHYFMPEAFGFTSGPVSLVAKLLPSGDRLEVGFADRTRRWNLIYRRANDPSFKKYDTPRLDGAGQAVTQYGYRVPVTTEMKTAEAAAVGVRVEPIEHMVRAVLEGRQRYRDSLLVVTDGKLILEEYFYGFERDRLHTLMSITKSVTGLIIGTNVAEGKFDIERPIVEYFPEYPDSPWRRADRRVTSEQLMRMADVLGWGDNTAGNTKSVELEPGMPRLERDALFMQGLFMPDLPGWLLAQTPLPDRPNSFYLYNTMYTQLTSAALARATGAKLREEVARRLLEPLGERDWDYFAFPGAAAQTYAESVPAAGSGLMLRPLALAKYGVMVSDCGRWNGRQLFPADWIARSATLRSIAPDRSDDGYGYNWELYKVLSQPDGQVHWVTGHTGHGGQALYIVPDYGLVFVTTSFDFDFESKENEKDLLLKHLLPAVAPPGTTFVPAHILPQDLHTAPLARCASSR
ncbi:MAG: serine hydrolase domain-containing protein [Pseudonocardiaceae bacterium]